ncbi:MAG TPA: CapA family protein [Candidatus Woesebacteria bacterium]|nr:CapA family protein [Candidatus Woesebacteria bacterium]
MSRITKYILLFLLGLLLGLFYLVSFQPQLIGLAKRHSLNSGLIGSTGEMDVEISTPTPTPSPPTLTLLFAGDLMLDRHVRSRANETGFDALLGESLRQLLLKQDLVIVNLEGPITQSPSVSVGSEPGSTNNYIFTFDPHVTDFLSKYQMRLVSLGNNHITNFGIDGVISTLNYLYQAKIEHFGWVAQSHELNEYNQEYLVISLNDFNLGFVNFNQFSSQPFESALNAVVLMREKTDFVIVYTHWGEEYVPNPNQVIKNQAHQLIEAGADLVIGSHPHVIQPMEEYQGKRVYYSLGNFIFDQYFSPEVSLGQLVEMTLTKSLPSDSQADNQVENYDSGSTNDTLIEPVFREFYVKMAANQPIELVVSGGEITSVSSEATASTVFSSQMEN